MLGIYATYTGYVIGQFRNKYSAVTSWADAGQIIAGRPGYEILGVAQCFILIFIMAAHLVSFSIMMNVLTSHATCSIIFGVLGTVISFIGGLPRTWKGVSYSSIICEIPRLGAWPGNLPR